MASLLDPCPREIRLLDPGAGEGALVAAFVDHCCRSEHRPAKITATAYEIDSGMMPALQESLKRCRAQCEQVGISFDWELRNQDFVEAALLLVKGGLFGASERPFNTAILNPPYRKIGSASRTRLFLRQAGIETSNLYTGFLALTAKLLESDGQLIAICPRSFCNGPYFKPFREEFLNTMTLRRLHLFGSRKIAFRHDDVLQENVIMHAVKSIKEAETVVISTSFGNPDAESQERTCRYRDVVSPDDPNRFIHLPTAESDEHIRRTIAKLKTGVEELRLEVSTGRVVDFRARRFLVSEPRRNAAPLIYPCHFDRGFVLWPKHGTRKPNWISDNELTQELLVPGANYVLVKRFTSKEERRRVVACVYNAERVQAERVGFENHLNYFHAKGRGLSIELAKGLAAFLNSTVVDLYFRQFSGHTQVNAADLRALRYPTRPELEDLGRHINDLFPEQTDLDALVERVLR